MNTLEGFEKFTEGPLPSRRPLNQPRITLNSKGLIYLNAFAYEMLRRPKAVDLHYSKAERAIAIEPTAAPTHESFFPFKKERGWALHILNFCRKYGINVPTTVRFLTPVVNDGIMYLRMRDTAPVAAGRRPTTGRDAN